MEVSLKVEVRNFIRLEVETSISSAAGETKSWVSWQQYRFWTRLPRMGRSGRLGLLLNIF
ncbi:hypothetical protein PILCRDRAFT_825317 [Piloderma croceum F 1598]|uniref:Uncharacterized protein n=1 Tax=Piloderma croceum (strain F 1598) TaxID=765440 RepID=A0A0C3FCL6_PILCF|nr:hypothetical protein PILCRDRAFT_825317 [Piloderma croceum F 1598]